MTIKILKSGIYYANQKFYGWSLIRIDEYAGTIKAAVVASHYDSYPPDGTENIDREFCQRVV